MRRYNCFFIAAAIFAALLPGCATQNSGGLPGDSQHYVAVDMLNLRACAKPTCRIISVLKRGDSGVIIDQQSAWVKLELNGKGMSGWVAKRYLSSTPVAANAPASSAGKNHQAPRMPEETFASPESTPPAVAEEFAIPEASGKADPAQAIEEEFAR